VILLSLILVALFSVLSDSLRLDTKNDAAGEWCSQRPDSVAAVDDDDYDDVSVSLQWLSTAR